MDSVLLLALPLVGGLIFCSRWNFTRWRVAREDGHRLYFRAVFYGTVLFLIAAALRAFLDINVPRYAAWEEIAHAFLRPLAKEPTAASALSNLAITCFAAMCLGWPLAQLLNLGFRKKIWLRRAIRRQEFESLLLDAADRERPIAVTMDDGKVYVGYIVQGYDPAVGRKYIQLLPLMSGYRTEETHTVAFTTFYTELYGDTAVAGAPRNAAAKLPGELDHLRPEDFITLFPVDRIASCRLFDSKAYLAFQRSTAGASGPQVQPPNVPIAATPQPASIAPPVTDGDTKPGVGAAGNDTDAVQRVSK